MGIHKWDNYKSVKSILPILHAKGWEQMHNHNEFMNRKGRECYYCKKQQYAVFVSLYIGTKYYNTIRPKIIKLPPDHKTIYNGQEVKWFIGDRNAYRALEIGCAIRPSENEIRLIDEDGFYWEAWGSCNGRPYQMFAWYNRLTREIIDPSVLPATNTIKKLDGSIIEEPAYYFDQETYDLLTKPQELLGGVIKPTINKMVENQNFGQAIEALKQGKRVARQGWNGKGMFIFQRPADELEVGFIITKVKSLPQSVKDFFKAKDEKEAPSEQGLTKVKFGSYLCMYAADGTIVNGWLASQTDMLSDDWCILD